MSSRPGEFEDAVVAGVLDDPASFERRHLVADEFEIDALDRRRRDCLRVATAGGGGHAARDRRDRERPIRAAETIEGPSPQGPTAARALPEPAVARARLEHVLRRLIVHCWPGLGCAE